MSHWKSGVLRGLTELACTFAAATLYFRCDTDGDVRQYDACSLYYDIIQCTRRGRRNMQQQPAVSLPFAESYLCMCVCVMIMHNELVFHLIQMAMHNALHTHTKCSIFLSFVATVFCCCHCKNCKEFSSA